MILFKVFKIFLKSWNSFAKFAQFELFIKLVYSYSLLFFTTITEQLKKQICDDRAWDSRCVCLEVMEKVGEETGTFFLACNVPIADWWGHRENKCWKLSQDEVSQQLLKVKLANCRDSAVPYALFFFAFSSPESPASSNLWLFVSSGTSDKMVSWYYLRTY